MKHDLPTGAKITRDRHGTITVSGWGPEGELSIETILESGCNLFHLANLPNAPFSTGRVIGWFGRGSLMYKGISHLFLRDCEEMTNRGRSGK